MKTITVENDTWETLTTEKIKGKFATIDAVIRSRFIIKQIKEE